MSDPRRPKLDPLRPRAGREVITPTRPCRDCYKQGYSDGGFDFWCSTCCKAPPGGARVVMMKTLDNGTEIALVVDPSYSGPPRITFERKRRSLWRRLVDFIRAWRDFPRARLRK